MPPHSPAEWACGQPVFSTIRVLTINPCVFRRIAYGRRKTTTPPARELERAMVVQRAPCIRVVEGEASVAPLDHARSPLPICPHRIAMYQVRTDHQPRAVACLRVCSHLGRTFL